MVKATFFVIYLTFLVLYEVECEENCDKLGTLLYEDLGCKPVKRPGKECPIKYECDDFTQLKDSCLFRGRKYALNEQIDRDITYESCNVGCYCNNNIGASLESEETIDPIMSSKQFLCHSCSPSPKVGTSFTCAVLDCPEWLGVPVKPGCFRKHEVDKCCSVGMTCPTDDNPIEECDINGKKYKEGEKFFPSNTCMKCVCPKNFRGKFESPFCKRISCGVQINHAGDLHNACAPGYGKSSAESLCCPDAWVCPSSSDKITKVNEDVEVDTDLTCTFGTKVINLGEGFDRKLDLYGSERNFKCECILPPLLTCKEV